MPVPKRYFHCSQEINGDPEMWQFTSEFGDRSLRTWLQILVYLDRSANQWRVSGDWLATLSRMVRQSVATVSREIGWLVEKQWLIVRETAADGSPVVFEAPNWGKYNRTQEHKRVSSTPDSGTQRERIDTPSFPTPTPTPSLSLPKDNKEEKKEKSCEHPETGARLPLDATRGASVQTWEAYAAAYVRRYGHAPIRNAKVNSILSQFVTRLPADKAPLVAAFYVDHNSPFYVSRRHPVNLLLQDAEGLHTQWISGVKATTGEAKNAERRDDAMAQIQRIEAMRRERA